MRAGGRASYPLQDGGSAADPLIDFLVPTLPEPLADMHADADKAVIARGKPDSMRELQRFLADRGIQSKIEAPPASEGGCGSG